jgi:hypothetical protein
MFQKIRNAALSAVLGLGTLAAMPASAQADSFYFGITPHGPRAGVVIDEGRSYRPDRDRGRWERDRGGRERGHGRWGRGHRWGHWNRGCSAWEAVRKANRMGIYRAHVRGEYRGVIRVGGLSRGRYVTVAFAKAPHCPVIG